MTVMVDELRPWPTKIRCFRPGSCHLTATTLDELHAFAKRLGLKREWFQDHVVAPHYDLTVKTRAKALSMGAIRRDERLDDDLEAVCKAVDAIRASVTGSGGT